MTIGVPVAALPVVEPLAAAGPAVPVDVELVPEPEPESELEPHPATTSPAATVAQATINLARENTCPSPFPQVSFIISIEMSDLTYERNFGGVKWHTFAILCI
jgi:hypothetical protein